MTRTTINRASFVTRDAVSSSVRLCAIHVWGRTVMRHISVPLFVAIAALLSQRAAGQPLAPMPQQAVLDQIAKDVQDTKSTVEGIKRQSWIRDWGPLIGSVIAAIVAVVSMWRTLNTTKTIAQKNIESTMELAKQNRDATAQLAEQNLQ